MKRACAFAAVGLLSGPCLADVAYDRLSDFTAPPTQAFTAVPFHAEDVTLDNPGGEALTGVDLLCRLRSGSTLTNFEGTLHLRLFGSTPGTNSPLVGEEFYASSTPINLQRGVDSVISFALPEVAAPGQTIYVGWYFERTGGSVQWFNDVWVRQNAARHQRAHRRRSSRHRTRRARRTFTATIPIAGTPSVFTPCRGPPRRRRCCAVCA